MNGSDERDQLLAAVRSATDEAARHALAGDPQGVVALINLGMDLADAGLTFAGTLVLEGLDRLKAAGAVEPTEATWILNLRGLAAFASGDVSTAVDLYRRALELAQAAGDVSAISNATLNLGIASWQSGDLPGALDYFDSGLATVGRRDRRARHKIEVNLVGLYFDLGKDTDARRLLGRLQRSRQFHEDARLRAAVYGLRGLAAAREQDLLGAERLLLRSLGEARTAGAHGHELAALQNLAAVRLDLGRIGGALRRLRQAARLAERLGTYRVLDPVQRTLATALYRAGRSSDAQRVLGAAADSAATRGDLSARSRAWTELGSLLVLGRQPTEALELLEPSLEAHLEADDRDWAIKSLTALSRALVDAGRAEEVEPRFARTLDRLDAASPERADLLEALGDLLLDASAVAPARAAYRMVAAALADSADASDRMATIGDKLSKVDPAEAVSFYTSALKGGPGRREINLDQVLNDRALAYAAQGSLRSAADDLSSALIAARSRRDRIMQAIILTNASEVARRSGEPAAALKMAVEALGVSRRTGPGPRADAFAARALAELALEDLSSARRSARRAIALAHRVGDRSAEAIALGVLAACEFQSDRFDRAVTHWTEAASIEAAERDPVREIESVAGLIEATARLKDKEATETNLQRLIDLVQTYNAPLDLAQTAIARASSEWLSIETVETASELFAVLLLLTAAESVGEDPNALVTAIARQAFVEFHLVRDKNQDLVDRLDKATRKRLKRRFGSSAGPLIEIMTAMRAAAEKRGKA